MTPTIDRPIRCRRCGEITTTPIDLAEIGRTGRVCRACFWELQHPDKPYVVD